MSALNAISGFVISERFRTKSQLDVNKLVNYDLQYNLLSLNFTAFNAGVTNCCKSLPAIFAPYFFLCYLKSCVIYNDLNN